MKKSLLLFLLAMVSTLTFAENPWRPKTRGVTMDSVVNCSADHMRTVIEKFAYQFQACPDSLFKWAYEGLGSVEPDKPAEAEKEKKSKEGRDALALVYKDRMYNAETKEGDVAIDIYVLGSRWFKDNHLGTVLHQSNHGQIYRDSLIATYSGSILDGGLLFFHVTPIDAHHCQVHYSFHLTFGKVLATFISNKLWTNVAQWRFKQIFRNLVEYAETGTVKKKNGNAISTAEIQAAESSEL